MAIATLPAPSLHNPLQLLWGWIQGITSRRPPAPAPRPVAAPVWARRAQPPRPVRPLRVVRVLEAGERRDRAGRMVISGRMADVCAELDRLAEREARGQ